MTSSGCVVSPYQPSFHVSLLPLFFPDICLYGLQNVDKSNTDKKMSHLDAFSFLPSNFYYTSPETHDFAGSLRASECW